MATHVCPCGCGRNVSTERLACPTGWAWLKSARPDLAEAVMSTYTHKRRRTLNAEARGAAVRAHWAAVAAASLWYRAQRAAAL